MTGKGKHICLKLPHGSAVCIALAPVCFGPLTRRVCSQNGVRETNGSASSGHGGVERLGSLCGCSFCLKGECKMHTSGFCRRCCVCAPVSINPSRARMCLRLLQGTACPCAAQHSTTWRLVTCSWPARGHTAHCSPSTPLVHPLAKSFLAAFIARRGPV
jgi:hypothetical protein